MTEDQNQETNETAEAPSQLEVLKGRADMLGIRYHPSISAEKLAAKIEDALADRPTEDVEEDAPKTGKTKASFEAEEKKQKEVSAKADAAKLIRIRVTCMNPAKREWDGEIFTAGNSVVGSYKKFVPFNNDEGWHVPYIIYQMMVDRKCTIYVKGKNKLGQPTSLPKFINEFAIEVLPPLTEKELKELATRQAMAKGQA